MENARYYVLLQKYIWNIMDQWRTQSNFMDDKPLTMKDRSEPCFPIPITGRTNQRRTSEAMHDVISLGNEFTVQVSACWAPSPP